MLRSDAPVSVLGVLRRELRRASRGAKRWRLGTLRPAVLDKTGRSVPPWVPMVGRASVASGWPGLFAVGRNRRDELVRGGSVVLGGGVADFDRGWDVGTAAHWRERPVSC